MNSKVAKDFLLIAIIGTAYYFLYSILVGIAAAIGYPDWYFPFAQEHKVLSLVLLNMLTTVPAVALAAALAGFTIVKLISGHHIWWGIVIVICTTILFALPFGLDGSSFDFFLPQSVIEIPMFVAGYTFLPLSVALFVRRSRVNSE